MKQLIIVMSVFFANYTVHAQNNLESNHLAQILHSYYMIKDALVAGDSNAASVSATTFIKNLNGISYKFISEGNVNALLKDAGTIADAKNIDKQRTPFSNFSNNLADVTKALKLSDRPVYIQYCPMKKASWLSNEKAIKNPYFGSSMLTCGKVSETIQ